MKKSVLALSLTALFALAACNQQANTSKSAASGTAAASSSGTSATASAPAGLESTEKQLSYLLGYEISTQLDLAGLKKSGITINKDALFAAIEDQMAGTPSKMTPEQVQAVMTSVTEKMQAAAAKEAEAAAAAGKQWLEANKSKEGVQTTASGLQYSVKKEGTGAAIAKGDLVSVEYEGRLTNGEVFDSNKGGKDFDVPVVDNTVIKGWIEGLQLMKQGGEYTLYIPADLAYGNASPSPKIPAGSVLVFDIKVNAVRKGEGTKMIEQMQAAQKAQLEELQKAQAQAQAAASAPASASAAK
ncbi:FKBP-type peptidyl-prolyl cis-trans isomerase [Kingella denitrificans]|uniref:FKBP-type peptidyl-prolyl cis-trans isomerase n=1 Tax=Kingella denitrificans TaxID=502 RepID=UPI0028D3EA94|nr:FKBP-type peptidyl-prolyl cis-trans isomerase [Kingella denitrificans]